MKIEDDAGPLIIASCIEELDLSYCNLKYISSVSCRKRCFRYGRYDRPQIFDDLKQVDVMLFYRKLSVLIYLT